MRATRSVDTALSRAADLLGVEVTSPGRGQREVQLETPDGKSVVYSGKPAEVLYGVVYAATTDEDLGGFGLTFVDVQKAVKLAKIPQRGMSAHQTHLFRALTGAHTQ